MHEQTVNTELTICTWLLHSVHLMQPKAENKPMADPIDSSEPPQNGLEIQAQWKGNIFPNLAVQKTLAEQMRLTVYEIENRKRLLGLDEDKVRALTDCRDGIHQKIDGIVEEFYSIQIKTPEIALVIGDIETLARLRRAMRSYIMEMFDGLYDEAYVNKRLRIGKVHKRIGVSPKLYTTALRILHSLLRGEVKKNIPRRFRASRPVAGGAEHNLHVRHAARIRHLYRKPCRRGRGRSV